MKRTVWALTAACALTAGVWGQDRQGRAGLPPGFVAKEGTETDAASGLPMTILCVKNGSEMVLVPAGEFSMGSEKGEPDERPVHRVYLDAFYIDRCEVSNGDYDQFVKETRAEPPTHWFDDNLNAPDQPVLRVSRKSADAFCQWIAKRLPTEAEWEKAARGSDGRAYPWGNELPNAGGIYRANYETGKDGFKHTAPVKSFVIGISPYGCYHMAGNVWEWCNDWYDPKYYSYAPRDNPQGPGGQKYASHRGGSYRNKIEHMRSAFRSGFFHTFANPVIGFRCALSPVYKDGEAPIRPNR